MPKLAAQVSCASLYDCVPAPFLESGSVPTLTSVHGRLEGGRSYFYATGSAACDGRSGHFPGVAIKLQPLSRAAL